MTTPKENYLMLLRRETPEFIPSFFEPYTQPLGDELLTPQAAPDGPIVTSLGVTYIGSKSNNYGAMPAPNVVVLDDIRKWRDVIKLPDVSNRDWEGYYKKMAGKIDREKLLVATNGGDYFLTLVSLMGFENGLLAMYEEPEEVRELYDFVSRFYMMVLEKQFQYLKPDYYVLMDDDSAYRAPFFSLAMYKSLIKPYHKLHCDFVLNAGAYVERHDCGRCEQFIDDWIELGITAWGPAQVTNDLKGIKKKYFGKLAICGGWDNQGPLSKKTVDDDILLGALRDYVDAMAPGGGFSFSAMIDGAPDDPEAMAKREVIKNFYFDYVKNWYKTH